MSQPSDVESDDVLDFNQLLDSITLNLKVIGDIKDSDKIMTTSSNVEIDPSRSLRGIVRSYYGESRCRSLDKLNQIVEDVSLLSNQLLGKDTFGSDIINLPENNSKVLQDMIPDMTNAIKGLHNLKLTYKEDVLTENKLEMLIKKLSDQIDKIKYSMNVQ